MKTGACITRQCRCASLDNMTRFFLCILAIPLVILSATGGVYQCAMNPITLSQAINLTITVKTNTNRRPGYVSGLRCYLTAFARGRENMHVEEITAQMIEDWFAARAEKPVTRAANLGRLGALFSYCWRKGFIDTNPIPRVEHVIVDRQPPLILSVAQAKRLLEHTAAHYPFALTYLALSLLAGLRPGEAQQMTWSKINLERGVIRVEAEASKIRRRRIVELMPAAVKWLGYARGKIPLTSWEVRRMTWLYMKILGLSSWSQDVLRHSCASYWLSEIQDAGKVAHQLGNSAGILLRHYRELCTREDAEAFWNLRPTNGHQLELTL